MAKQDKTESSSDAPDLEIATKVSVKGIIGKIKRPQENDKPKVLCSIYGIVRGTKRGVSDKGEWLGFLGDFEGVSAEDGHRVRGSQLFLPKSAEGVLLSAFENATKPNEEGEIPTSGSVQFALEIGLKYSTNQFGYEYVVKPLIKPSDNDPLVQLRDSVRALLPAPKAS